MPTPWPQGVRVQLQSSEEAALGVRSAGAPRRDGGSPSGVSTESCPERGAPETRAVWSPRGPREAAAGWSCEPRGLRAAGGLSRRENVCPRHHRPRGKPRALWGAPCQARSNWAPRAHSLVPRAAREAPAGILVPISQARRLRPSEAEWPRRPQLVREGSDWLPAESLPGPTRMGPRGHRAHHLLRGWAPGPALSSWEGMRLPPPAWGRVSLSAAPAHSGACLCRAWILLGLVVGALVWGAGCPALPLGGPWPPPGDRGGGGTEGGYDGATSGKEGLGLPTRQRGATEGCRGRALCPGVPREPPRWC